MRILNLPGYTRDSNEPEMKKIAGALEAAGHDVYNHHWRHWSDPDSEWDAHKEVERLLEYIDGNYEGIGIVAKSAATYVATLLLGSDRQLKTAVTKVVYLGVPVRDTNLLDPTEYARTLGDFRGILTVIQREQDPHGSREEVEQYFEGTSYQLVPKDGDTHQYEYPDEVVVALA
jgi:hypothetical protein